MKSVFGLAAAGLVALATPALATTNLLTNGNFENNGAGFPGTSSYYNIGPNGSGADHAIPDGFGWTVPVNNVDIVSYIGYGPTAPNGGNYGLDLVGYGSTGEISQSFATTAGKTYDITLDYFHNPSNPGVTADVLINGSSIGSLDSGSKWEPFSETFVAGAGTSTTLAINETYGYGNGGVFLDNISVSAVPEPAAWTMMILGVFGAGASLRLNRRRQALARA